MENFELFAPKINTIVKFGGCLYRVSYVNVGKERVTFECLGYFLNNTQLKLMNGKVLYVEKFDEYRRKTWPLAHETGRNTANVTLSVDSIASKQKVKL